MIVLAGGGSGGHLAIIESLREELVSRGEKVVYIGSTRGQDKQWFQQDSSFFAKYFLHSSGFAGGFFNKIKAILFLIYPMFIVVYLFRKHKVTKVISVGGFSASASAFVAILFGYDLYIHEQNAVVGRLNKYQNHLQKSFFHHLIMQL